MVSTIWLTSCQTLDQVNLWPYCKMWGADSSHTWLCLFFSVESSWCFTAEWRDSPWLLSYVGRVHRWRKGLCVWACQQGRVCAFSQLQSWDQKGVSHPYCACMCVEGSSPVIVYYIIFEWAFNVNVLWLCALIIIMVIMTSRPSESSSKVTG